MRGSFRKDHDRLYYTPAFRRLTGVTQVAAPQSEVALIHNRYVHSDKVAQIGRALVEYVTEELSDADLDRCGGIDADVVAAAGLAHDIGHPPFGHAGEKSLHKLALEWDIDGFEGNAQTFRILTKLAVKSGVFPGLDLTRATRNAVLKYPWKFGEGPTPELAEYHRHKWCVYRTEGPDFLDARSIHVLPPKSSGEPSQSIEASIMEMADDISYALHDFEDFYRTGLIAIPALKRAASGLRPLEEVILDRVQNTLRDEFRHGLAKDAWQSVMEGFDDPTISALLEPYIGSLEQDAALVWITSSRISAFCNGISVDLSGAHPRLAVDEHILHEIAIWKQMTWQFVINRPGFGAVQRGQQQLVEKTAIALLDWVLDEGIDSPRLPQRLRDYYQLGIYDKDDPDYPTPNAHHVTARALIDFIASLTEPQLIDLHDQLVGAWRSSMLSGGVI